jgi:hypothetical protein
MLTAVKEGLQMYCATVYARRAVNQMILKNSKELLESLKSHIFFSNLQHQNQWIYNTL